MANEILLRVPNIKHGGGPKIFLDRIRKPLKKRGIIASDTGRFDVELAFISRKRKSDKPCILRVDGCYYQQSDLSRNSVIKKSIKSASHVIYQSEFSKNMCNKILKHNSNAPSSVIYNGFPLVKVDGIKVKDNIRKDSFVICSTNEVKRVEASIKGFLESEVDNHLYVIGDYKRFSKFQRHDNIHLLGKMSNQSALSVMKSCSYQMHLSYIDSCPNAVVEGLSLGLKVLCSNLGGTRELVSNSGIILNVDDDLNFSSKIITQRSIDKVKIAEGIHRLIAMDNVPVRTDLDITRVADEYAEVIRRFAK